MCVFTVDYLGKMLKSGFAGKYTQNTPPDS